MSKALYVWFSTVTEQTESHTHRKTTQTFNIQEVAPLPPKNSSSPLQSQIKQAFIKQVLYCESLYRADSLPDSAFL